MAIHVAAGTTQPRADLMSAYYEFDPSADGLIGDQVFPAMPVNKRKGDYGVITREAWLQRINTKRSPKSETSESDWDPESASFSLLEYAHKEFVPDPTREDYMDWFDMEEIATGRVARIIAIDAEIDAATAAFNTTTFPLSGTTGLSLSNPWSDASAGTPVNDIETGKNYVGDKHGVEADTLICDRYVWGKLSLNSQVRANLTDMYGKVKPGMIPLDQLAVVLNLRQIIVAGWGAVYNSAKPGKAATTTKIWDQTKALLTRIETGRDIQRPQLGRTFTIKSEDVAVESWRVTDPKGGYVRAERNLQRKTSPDPVGFLFGNVTA